jgi:chemotaxis methyl-accepting protein methylase/signal transduction histidine kinase
VGMGASAGGLEALKGFFGAMPADSGMAFVIVQHLEPRSESRMAEILGKITAMPAVQAEDGMPVEPNAVYTNPPGRSLTIRGGRLVLGKSTGGGHVETAIDHFMTSLGDDQGSKAICIVLSGSSGLDGPRGVRAVRAAGGMCMAQDPSTAQFAAMPQAAIDTGLVDYVLGPAQLPAALLEFAQHPQVRAAGREESPAGADAGDMEAILKLLHTRTNSDYRHYKRTTVSRRIQRRMGLRQIAGMGEYIKLLQGDAGELTQLARDMLIGVSSFFRDAGAFEELRAEALVPLVGAKPDDASLRAWVAGCATGEEAYSIAMLLLEARQAAGKTCPVQVFATDVDERALETARAGAYPLSIADDVRPHRLEAFFVKQGQTYQVDKSLREAVIFSRHNLLADPPFSKLDLVSCRNVLIYIEPAAQKKVLSVFSFALNVGGCLLLGKSEGVAEMAGLFEPISKHNRLYRLTRSNRQAAGEFPLYPAGRQASALDREPAVIDPSVLPQAKLEAILRHFGASLALIDPQGKVLSFHGQAEKYLGRPKGLATLNILDMTDGTLSAKLGRAMDRALQRDEPVNLAQILLPGGRTSPANLTVMRVPEGVGGGKLLAVIFEDARQPRPPASAQSVPAEDEPLVAQLEAEVQTLRAELRTNTEGYDTAAEELKAANEEVMSMNEELQSANEELEASKEELQSLNEELATVNSQLNDKVGELTKANNDLANLMAATRIATIFLDDQLRIRQFTPAATKLLSLIDSDLGRPVGHVTQNFTGVDLAADARTALQSLAPLEKEVQDREGQWYTMRILPYRTLDNRIEGTVVTFSNVSRLKEVESHLRYEKTYAERIAETVRHPLLVLDGQLQVLSANRAFYEAFRVDPNQTTGREVYDLGNGQWNIPQLRTLLEDILPKESAFEDFRVEHEFEQIGRKVMLLSGRHIQPTGDMPERLLLTIEDITQRDEAEVELLSLSDRLARSNTDLEQFAYVVSHDLQEPLRMITGFLGMLGKRLGDRLDDKSQEYVHFVTEGAQRMQAMIKDLLEFSRLGREDAKRTAVDLGDPLSQALGSLRGSIEQSQAKVTYDPLPTLTGDPSQLVRLFQNLIGNALKFRRKQPPEIHIEASPSQEGWRISVRDNGIGIDLKSAERVFQVFQRLHTREKYEGTGIGLAICKRIVEQHGGRIWLESEVGKGTTFYFTLPTGVG